MSSGLFSRLSASSDASGKLGVTTALLIFEQLLDDDLSMSLVGFVGDAALAPAKGSIENLNFLLHPCIRPKDIGFYFIPCLHFALEPLKR